MWFFFYRFPCNHKEFLIFFSSLFIPYMFQSSPSSICYSLYTTHDLHFTEQSLFFSSASVALHPRGIQVPLKSSASWHDDVKSTKLSFFFCPSHDFRNPLGMTVKSVVFFFTLQILLTCFDFFFSPLIFVPRWAKKQRRNRFSCLSRFSCCG